MTTKTNLTMASRHWAQRPADERFWTLGELFNRTKQYARECGTSQVRLSQCHAIPVKDDIYLEGPTGAQAQFLNYSFGQLCNIAKAPASYLRELPAPLAASNLNHGLVQVTGTQSLLFHKNGGLHLRCVTSDEYKRIWNYEVAELALALEENEGWRVPPARPCGMPDVPTRIATDSDVLRNSSHPGLGIKVGDQISPAGLYASDHDLFIFQVNEDYSVDGGDGETLHRGVFWTNSEVGDARFRGTMFLYDSVCGNHIVWGAKVIAEISIRHTGNARAMFAQAMATVTRNLHTSASQDRQRISAAKQLQLADTKEDVINLVFRKNIGLSKDECENSYVLADRHCDEHGGNPLSAWGFASGVTRLSQQQWADKRDRMDRAAGKIIELAF
jgi:hypothetical protein